MIRFINILTLNFNTNLQKIYEKYLEDLKDYEIPSSQILLATRRPENTTYSVEKIINFIKKSQQIQISNRGYTTNSKYFT